MPRFLLIALVAGLIIFVLRKYVFPPAFVRCFKCDGQGYWQAMRGEKERCDQCGGSGRVPRVR